MFYVLFMQFVQHRPCSGDVTEEIKMSWVQLMVDSNVMKHFNIDDGMELEDGEEPEENKHQALHYNALHCIAPPEVQMPSGEFTIPVLPLIDQHLQIK